MFNILKQIEIIFDIQVTYYVFPKLLLDFAYSSEMVWVS